MPTLAVYDKVQLDFVVSAQLGLITRSQALACGLRRSALSHRLRQSGPWRPVLPGVYSCLTGSPTQLQRAMAGLLYTGPESLITGSFAVRALGIDIETPPTIVLLVPDHCMRKSADFARVQRTTRMPQASVRIGPLRYAPLPRAIADTVRGLKRSGDVQALVCKGIQLQRCTVQDLDRELHEGPMQGSRLFREAITALKAGVWSSPEADLKRLIDRSRLEKPIYNPMLYSLDGTFLGCPDAWWQRAGVAAEVDSLQYHLDAAGYGKTVRKHTRMTAAGITVLHWLPATIRNDPKTVIADLQAALATGYTRDPLPIRAVRAR